MTLDHSLTIYIRTFFTTKIKQVDFSTIRRALGHVAKVAMEKGFGVAVYPFVGEWIDVEHWREYRTVISQMKSLD